MQKMLPCTSALAARALARRNDSCRAVRPIARAWTRSFASTSDNAASSITITSKLLDESIMAHLVCPISKLPLRYDTTRDLLICPEIRIAYPIYNGVPVLVPSEGRLLRKDEAANGTGRDWIKMVKKGVALM